MKIMRRNVLKMGLLSSFVSQWSLVDKLQAAETVSERFPYSVLQGATDESKTQFSVLHSQKEELSFLAEDSTGNRIFPDYIQVIRNNKHQQVLSKPFFSGLSLDEDYQLHLIDTNQIVDTREFRMLDLEKNQVRFAIASCMDEANHEPGIWRDMISQGVDVILFVGDSVYADRGQGAQYGYAATPDHLWKRFCEARKTLEIYNSSRLVPIIATWDDHDFGQNDSGMEYPYVQESQQNFLNFFAQDESYCRGLVRGPGVSSALQFKDQLFLLMDDRSFRRKNDHSVVNAHWGNEQVQWAMGLAESFKGFIWFCNGSQIYPAMIMKESVSKEHPQQLKSVSNKLKTYQSKVAFISGDVHYSEISEIEEKQLGYVTYELTSSSIHSKTLPGIPELIPNKRRIVATGKRNYLLVNASLKDGLMRAMVDSRSKNDKLNFTRYLNI